MIAGILAAIGGRGVALLAGVAAALALLAGVYQAGVNAERKRGEAATLRATVVAMKRQQQTAIEIQTRMAQRMAELRAAQQERQGKIDELVETFRREPAAPRFTNADLMRLRAIRVGPARAAAGGRQ